MENEYNVQTGVRDQNKLMSYPEQTRYLQNIKLSLSSFPEELKQTIEVLFTETKKCASGNDKFLEASFEKSMEASLVSI